jgi:outer membrane receptor for ferrienterochelin and colicins
MIRLLLWATLLLGSSAVMAQSDVLQGTILGQTPDETFPLVGANVYWRGTTVGISTDPEGQFVLERPPGAEDLIVTFIGFGADTLSIDPNRRQVEITLRASDEQLDEITIREKAGTTNLRYLDVNLTENISERELFKAACCDLSESFETNPSVDASFTDAVTGTRQIRLLGLDGPYSTYTRGNIRALGGLASVYGLALIPGTWIKSIQLTKGTGSAVNGYSSVTGQINYELRGPSDPEKLFVNGYVNGAGRLEENAVWSAKLNDQWGAALLIHGRHQLLEVDRNEDGFLDVPVGNHFFIQNVWKRFNTDGLGMQFGVKYSLLDHWSGQEGYRSSEISEALWGFENRTNRIELWGKGGYVLDVDRGQSFGFQVNYTYHDLLSTFGGLNRTVNAWEGTEQSAYVNGIYETWVRNPKHTIKLGASFVYHNQDETFNDDVYDRLETIPGAFAEYTWADEDLFSVVLGIRADQHNLYGLNVTPRLHTRWALSEQLVLRASAGKAYRTPNVFAERMGLMASNRAWRFTTSSGDLPYGLRQEEAWNFGLSASQEFELDFRPGAIRVDYYYTDFQNQIVTDLYATAREVRLYNLDGRSFSHSLQVQLDYEVVRRLDVRMAYRYLDVQSTFDGVEQAVPYIAPHRAFINASYASRDYWKADVTVQWQGVAKLPTTEDNAPEYRIAPQAPDFVTVNLQLSKEWPTAGWEIYLGVENLTNFKMTRPIVSAEDPFDEAFDASMVWGPILGRMYYAGFRWRVLRGV